MKIEAGMEDVAVYSDNGLPLWFKPEKFAEPDFDPDAYVNDLRRFVSVRCD